MLYNWQLPDWPNFQFDAAALEAGLIAFAHETGQVSGLLHNTSKAFQLESLIAVMVAEAMNTSAIEGEHLSRLDVASSIRNQLELNEVPERIKDKKAQGVAMIMVDVRRSLKDPLTEEKLFEWHRMLMIEVSKINAGAWRKSEAPMQIVSGAFGKEKVQFEAPPSLQVPLEMSSFIKWYNDSAPGGRKEIKHAPIRAAIAHLYFESIHPFEDGNGRIGRAIAEKALSETIGRPLLLSLSRSIATNRKGYYMALKEGSKSNEITDWIRWFVDMLILAQQETNKLISFTLRKTSFFDKQDSRLNERQRKAVLKMFDAGPEGFQGGMTPKKYISMVKTTKATATRDLQSLVQLGIFIAYGGGRSTHYHLADS